MWTVEHLTLFLKRGVPNREAHQKPVKLRFRKGKCPMIFGRVLRSDDHKGLLKRMGLIIDGNLCLAHCFQKTALSLWRGAIDLVGQYNIGKDGTRYELKPLFLPIKHGDADDVGR